nr:pheromone receptor transcription activator-like [Aegilops tauschii subsp. strangulata]
MPRQEVRSGVCRIENDKKRNAAFTKRHAHLFKSASNLSALTGVRVAVILEKESGKMHGFGTPLVQPIVDSFLSGDPLVEPLVDEQVKDRIALLQSEVARLHMENEMLKTRANLSLQHIKKIQSQNSGMPANNIFSKVEDLSLEDLTNLFNNLLRVKEEIRRRLPPLQHGHEPKSVVDHAKDLPPPLQPQFQYYASPNTITKPLQNNMSPNSIVENTMDESPRFFYSGGNDTYVHESFSYDNLSNAPLDKAHEILGMDSYLDYNISDLEQYKMDCVEWANNAPPGSSGGNDDDIDG